MGHKGIMKRRLDPCGVVPSRLGLNIPVWLWDISISILILSLGIAKISGLQEGPSSGARSLFRRERRFFSGAWEAVFGDNCRPVPQEAVACEFFFPVPGSLAVYPSYNLLNKPDPLS